MTSSLKKHYSGPSEEGGRRWQDFIFWI